jgi:hypothetical protein
MSEHSPTSASQSPKSEDQMKSDLGQIKALQPANTGAEQLMRYWRSIGIRTATEFEHAYEEATSKKSPELIDTADKSLANLDPGHDVERVKNIYRALQNDVGMKYLRNWYKNRIDNEIYTLKDSDEGNGELGASGETGTPVEPKGTPQPGNGVSEVNQEEVQRPSTETQSETENLVIVKDIASKMLLAAIKDLKVTLSQEVQNALSEPRHIQDRSQQEAAEETEKVKRFSDELSESLVNARISALMLLIDMLKAESSLRLLKTVLEYQVYYLDPDTSKRNVISTMEMHRRTEALAKMGAKLSARFESREVHQIESIVSRINLAIENVFTQSQHEVVHAMKALSTVVDSMLAQPQSNEFPDKENYVLI